MVPECPAKSPEKLREHNSAAGRSSAHPNTQSELPVQEVPAGFPTLLRTHSSSTRPVFRNVRRLTQWNGQWDERWRERRGRCLQCHLGQRIHLILQGMLKFSTLKGHREKKNSSFFNFRKKFQTEQPTSSQHERVVWDPSVAGMPAGMLTPGSSFMFPGLYPPNSPFGVLQMEAISNAGQSRLSSPSPLKRRPSSEDEDEESPSNKRVRTTIQPEQLDYLYQQYRLDSNPSRKQLEMIASKTGKLNGKFQ
jgi:hypothetical protein